MNGLERYWHDIPIGRENAITYPELCFKWECSPRKVRDILHKLSLQDNKDAYILIRSSHGKGFYKTDDLAEIIKYEKECSNRAIHIFATMGKMRRVIKDAATEEI